MTPHDLFDSSPAIRSTTVVAGSGSARIARQIAAPLSRAIIHPGKALAVKIAFTSTTAQTARCAR